MVLSLKSGVKGEPTGQGETCYISAAPTLDSGGHIGIWMVMIVDKIAVASTTHRTIDSLAQKEAEIQSQPAGLPMEEIPVKPALVGQLDEVQEEALKAIMDGEDNNASKARSSDEDINTSEIPSTMTDGLPESPNSSPEPDLQLQSPEPESTLPTSDLESPDSILQDTDKDGSRTLRKTSANDDALPDEPPRQRQDSIYASLDSSGGARDVGLRAMDYLTSRSTSMRQTQLPNEVGDGKDEEESSKKDRGLASPYSID